MKLATFRKQLKADGFNPDDPCDAVTLAAYVVGPSIERIASFLGRPRKWCAGPARVLRHQGVWRGSRIVVEGDGPDGVELAMQCCVARGWLEIVAA